MADLGRWLLVLAMLFAVAGGLLLAASRLGFRRFPGTLVVSGRHGTLVFPVLLCLILSIVISFLLSLWRR